MSTVKSSRISTSRIRAPQIKVGKYDVFVAALTTTSMFGALMLVALVAVWLSNMLPRPSKQRIEMQALAIMPPGDGGWEDGVLNATPNVDSPEEPSLDPSLANEESDVTELAAVTEQVMEYSQDAAAIVAPNEFTGVRNTGIPGSAEGTGGRPLGRGGPGRGGEKREQRWFVEFADKGDLKSYAAQLDFFGIELGAKFETEGRLVYLSSMSQAQPATRQILSSAGESEKRLFMNWADGSEERRKADLELFQKAGIDASQAAIMHFYPPETEQMMAVVEQEYGGRAMAEIRRTYFRVRPAGGGYEFFVQSQQLR